MIILSKKQKKSETNIHLDIKVINKGPSEHFWERRPSDLFFASVLLLSRLRSDFSPLCLLAAAAALHDHFLVVL